MVHTAPLWLVCASLKVRDPLSSRAGARRKILRTDGVGILDVRATIETHDGALIYAAYSGVIDLGEDGYQKFLQGELPASGTPIRTAPCFYTMSITMMSVSITRWREKGHRCCSSMGLATAGDMLTVSNQVGAGIGASAGGVALAFGGFPVVGVFCFGAAAIAAMVMTQMKRSSRAVRPQVEQA